MLVAMTGWCCLIIDTVCVHVVDRKLPASLLYRVLYEFRLCYSVDVNLVL